MHWTNPIFECQVNFGNVNTSSGLQDQCLDHWPLDVEHYVYWNKETKLSNAKGHIVYLQYAIQIVTSIICLRWWFLELDFSSSNSEKCQDENRNEKNNSNHFVLCWDFALTFSQSTMTRFYVWKFILYFSWRNINFNWHVVIPSTQINFLWIKRWLRGCLFIKKKAY